MFDSLAESDLWIHLSYPTRPTGRQAAALSCIPAGCLIRLFGQMDLNFAQGEPSADAAYLLKEDRQTGTAAKEKEREEEKR